MIPGDPPAPSEKLSSLLSLLGSTGNSVIAFSGGVDSTLLVRAAQIAGIRFIAVTAVSETMPAHDLEDAAAFAGEKGFDHQIIRTEELSNTAFADNTPDRCYHCKEELFRKLTEMAKELGFTSVLDGSNADDLQDYRPGKRAAGQYRVRSPLAECGLTKEDVRQLSQELGLSTWDRPSSPCLASRIPYGQKITASGLARTGKAEAFLRELGVREVRVRSHGDVARIEVPEKDLGIFLKPGIREKVVSRLKEFGYAYVSLDLEGFRSGSLNRVLAGAGNGATGKKHKA